MKKQLEDTLRKALDKLLQSTLENRYYQLMNDSLLNSIKSKEDFLFGIIVGDMLEGLGFCTYGVYKRYPKDREFKDLFKIIQSREEGIREKIKSILAE